MWNYTLVEKHGLRITLAYKGCHISAFQGQFLCHTKYTSNMAACHDNDVNGVTAPRVCSSKWICVGEKSNLCNSDE